MYDTHWNNIYLWHQLVGEHEDVANTVAVGCLKRGGLHLHEPYSIGR